MPGLLTLKNNTFFKQDYQKQAKDLPPTDKYEAKAGQEFEYAYIEPDLTQFKGHFKVHLDPPIQPKQGNAKQTWYIFAADVSKLDAS
ncbi:MAG TPA: hypothetical protein V6D48_01945 [Oculatellaceae cyanobacterium]